MTTPLPHQGLHRLPPPDGAPPTQQQQQQQPSQQPPVPANKAPAATASPHASMPLSAVTLASPASVVASDHTGGGVAASGLGTPSIPFAPGMSGARASESPGSATAYQSPSAAYGKDCTPSRVQTGSVAVSGPLRFRTRMCDTFTTGGTCNFGARCAFAHSREDLRTVAQNEADGLTTERAAAVFAKRLQKRRAMAPQPPPGPPVFDSASISLQHQHQQHAPTSQALQHLQLAATAPDALGGCHPLPPPSCAMAPCAHGWIAPAGVHHYHHIHHHHHIHPGAYQMQLPLPPGPTHVPAYHTGGCQQHHPHQYHHQHQQDAVYPAVQTMPLLPYPPHSANNPPPMQQVMSWPPPPPPPPGAFSTPVS